MPLELLDGARVVVLLSGGRDSVCLLDLAVGRAADVTALHVNYGLRAGAAADAAFCRELCTRLGVALMVRRPAGPPPAAPRVARVGAPAGNLQAWARATRYAAAAALPGDIAVGHTASDQVETVLYRLAASPGRRALLGMRERDGRVIRPLLHMTREETAAHCRARGLAWREDASNDDPAYARNRVRAQLLPALRSLHPAAEANVLRTLAILRAEAEVLDGLLDAPFLELPPALQRLKLQDLTDNVRPTAPHGGRTHVLAVGRFAAEVARLAARGGSATLDLGGGLRAVIEYGDVRVEPATEPAAPPAPTSLSVPGTLDWAGTLIEARRTPDGELDAEALGDTLTVRAWTAGDRIRLPAGTRSLQDLFTDRKVPRARRAHVPIVLVDGEIAWVAGVATAARFRATERSRDRVRLSWS